MTTDFNNDETPGENFEEMLKGSLERKDNFEKGEKVAGRVISISRENIFIDISGKSEAVIDAAEFRDKDGNLTIKKDDMLEAYVISTSGGEIKLTKNIGLGYTSPEMIEIAHANGVPVSGSVSGIVKGGYSISISGIKCFCPFSQIDIKPPSDENDMIGKTFSFRIIQFGERGRNIVLSRRALLEEERQIKEKSLRETLHAGDVVEGRVMSIKNFGVFLDLGGAEGLVPRSEISYSRYSDMSVFEIGTSIKAAVLDIDWDSKKITLSIKKTLPDPWDNAEKYEAGLTVAGRVVNLIKSGAFVEITPGFEGFLHISKMSVTKKISKPEDAVKIGDNITVKISGIDRKERKINLELVTGENNPWDAYGDSLVNTVQGGIIETVKPSGINIRLENGMLGYAPREELLSSDIKKYESGKELKVAVIRLDKKDRNMILSERGALKQEELEEFRKFSGKADVPGESSLGSMFKDQFDKIKQNLNK